MNAKDCTDNAIYLPTAEYVHSQEPSAPSAYAIGQGYAKKNELSKSLKYFEEAVELCPDCPERENYLLKAGQVASALKMTSKARSYANKVLDINPGSGDAYLLIGDVIAASSASCDDGKLGARSVYWLASDYYQKAKRVDPSVSDKADKKIASAASQYPSREDLFAFGKKEGESFNVSCFGEDTIIRERR
jgi:tetratricopeptide (TPR) repeat protein